VAKRRVIVELKYNRDLAQSAFAAAPAAEKELDLGTVPKIPGVSFDKSFSPAPLPGITPRSAAQTPYVSGEKFDLALDESGYFDPEQSTYVVRAEIDEGKLQDLSSHQSVAGVFADVQIQPTLICPGSPPMGTDADVERLLCVPQMHRIGMDGTGILLAIVDTGINLAHLTSRGKSITLDAARSWVPSAGMVPGNAPVGHGTMCAFDAAIAAPRATFLDIQLLRSSASGPTVMAGFLSDAVRAYVHLCNIMSAPRRPGENRTLVVNNSWGMFHPSWDFPVGHPGNYSDNPNHPFNRIVSTLERLGADILFAAGNCGANCPDGRCQGVTTNAIYGANGHPSVLTIAGVDISNTRVGYSTQGPGRLSRNKPDLCGYTHFRGSGVYPADGGTSAATPVVAGIVAAVRTKRPYSPGSPATTPAVIRALMRSTATDLGVAGFDFDHGYGVVGGCALYRRFRPRIPIDICERFPWLCRPRPIPVDICRRFPEICRGIPPRPIPPIPPIPPRPAPPIGSPTGQEDINDVTMLDEMDLDSLVEAAWQAGYYDGQIASQGSAGKPSHSGGCSCGSNK
jgi:subtilisin family serine protease